MKKSVAVVTLLGALLIGGAIGLALFGPSASAQTDSSSSSTDSSSSESDPSTTPPDSSTAPDESAPPMGRRGFGPGFGHGPRGAHPNLGVAASAIGISEDELRTALHDDQTIAQVAQAKGVDPQTVIDALVADASTRIDQAVADGKLPQERADEIKADLPQRMADFVNNAGMSGGCPGMGDGDGPEGTAPGSDSSSSSSSSNTSFRA